MKVDFYKTRRKEIIKDLPENSFIILTSSQIAQEKTNRNFFYLTGIERENYFYVAEKKNGSVEETMFIPKPDAEKAKWEGRMLTSEEVVGISGVEKIAFSENLEAVIHRKLSSGEYTTVVLDLNPEMYLECEPTNKFSQMLKTRYIYINLVNCYHKIAALRVFKTQDELEAMRKAMDITQKGIESMMKNCKPGMFEYQLDTQFNYILGMDGVQDAGFKTTVAAGGNEFYLHYSELKGNISDGDLVLVDCGAEVDGYCVDISRMFPANGKFNEKQRQIYSIALKANKAVMDIIKPGASFEQVLEVCKYSVFEGLKDLGLVKEYNEVSRYFWHGVAHYVGLEVHDVGSYNQLLAKDMVFTVDAGIYVPEWSVGLRIEDNILVTEDGCEHLSKDILREIDDIENLMRG
jgi:Xaa-Pro aminopeptidase